MKCRITTEAGNVTGPGNEREGASKEPEAKKKTSSGHELFEQATNEYAPVSHIILPWF